MSFKFPLKILGAVFVLLLTFNPTASFASRSGINLGTNYGSSDVQTAVNTVGSGGWVVVIANPGDCEKLNTVFSITDPANVNVIIRGHLNNQLYASDAPAWIATLGKLSNTKKAYFMPWNEPNQQGSADAPQNGPSQVVDYTTALLQEASNAGIRQSKFYFLSPMLNHTWIATYTPFFDALGGLSYFSNFDGVAMNLYDIDTADGPCSPLDEYNPLCAIDPHYNPSKAPSLVPGLKVYGVESGPGPGSPDRRFFYFTDFKKGYNAKFVDKFKGDGNSVMFAIPSYALAGETGWKLYSDSSDAVAIMGGQGGGAENVSFNQATFNTWLNAKSTSLKSCGSCGYEPTASPGLCSGVSGGTTNSCEVPLTQLAKPSCEFVTVEKTISLSMFNNITPCSNITATQVVPPIGVVPAQWKISCTTTASHTLVPSRDFYFFKEPYETYISWDNPSRNLGDNPESWTADKFSGRPPFSKEKISDTKNADGKYQLEEQGGMWGLLSYLSPPTVNTFYDQPFWDHLAQTGMLYKTAKILLPKTIPPATTVDSSLSGTVGIFVGGDIIDATPYTQSTLGGARLEQHIEPLAFFSAQKVSCSIMGRPGQTDCGPETSIYDFENYMAASETKYKNFALGDLVIRDSTSSSCSNPIVEETKKTPQSNLLASIAPVSINKTFAQNSQIAGQVLSASVGGGCHVGDTISEEEVKCPHDDTQGKAKVGLSGTVTKPTECDYNALMPGFDESTAKLAFTAVVGTNPTPTNSPLWGCDPITITSGIKQNTLPMWEWPTMNAWNNLVRAVFQSPTRRYWEGRSSEAGWDVGGSSTITVASNNKRTVEDGTTTGCMYTGAVASVSRPNEAIQPDSTCFEPPAVPIPTTTACGTGGVLWNNSNSKKGDGAVLSVSAGSVMLCGVITPVDPTNTNYARNPCNGERTVTFPEYKIRIDGTEYVLDYPGSFDPVIYNIQVPKNSTILIEAGGGTWDRYNSGVFSAKDKKCQSGYVFFQPVYSIDKNDPSKYDTQSFCGKTDSCLKYKSRNVKDIKDSYRAECTNVLKGEEWVGVGSCLDESTGKVGLGCAGRFWACSTYGSSILRPQSCTSCPTLAPPPIIDIEDVDCHAGNCVAVGHDSDLTLATGYILRSSNSDNGDTWSVGQKPGLLFKVQYIPRWTPAELFVTGQHGAIYYSPDSGIKDFRTAGTSSNESVYVLGLRVYKSSTNEIKGYAGLSGSGGKILTAGTEDKNFQFVPEFTDPNVFTTDDFAISEDGSTVISAQATNRYLIKRGGSWNVSLYQVGTPLNSRPIRSFRVRAVNNEASSYVFARGDNDDASPTFGYLIKCENFGASCKDVTPTGMTNVKYRGLDFYRYTSGGTVMVAVGSKGTILVSRDSGESWTKTSSGVTTDLLGVKIIDHTTAVVVGENNTILKTTTLNTTVNWEKKEFRATNIPAETWN